MKPNQVSHTGLGLWHPPCPNMVCLDFCFFVCSFRERTWMGTPRKYRVLSASAALPSSALYFGALSMFADSHSNFYCYVIFHCKQVCHSICSFYCGWTSGIFPTYCYYKNAAIHVFPISLCHIQDFLSSRCLGMDFRRWASSTGLGSINQFPEHLNQFPHSSTLGKSSALYDTSSPTHVTYFHNTSKQGPGWHTSLSSTLYTAKYRADVQ